MKTLVDIDHKLLARAGKLLGTKTKKDTVNAALGEVIALAKRHRHLERLEGGNLPDLADPELMAKAWR